MGARFCDAPVLNNQYLICLTDCGEAMRYYEGGPVPQQEGKRLLDDSLGDRVEAGCGLVQYQKGGISQDGARNRYPLPLPHRQRNSPLAHDRFVTTLEPISELGNVGQNTGALDLLPRCFRAAKSYVFQNRTAEQNSILRDDPKLRPIGV